MAMTILPGWWRAGPTTPDPGARPFSGVTAGEAGKSAIATSPHRHIATSSPTARFEQDGLIEALTTDGIPHLPEGGRAIVRDPIDIGGLAPRARPGRARDADAGVGTPMRCPAGLHRATPAHHVRPGHRTQPAPRRGRGARRRDGRACSDRGYTPVLLPPFRAAERRRDARVFIAPSCPAVFARNAERSLPPPMPGRALTRWPRPVRTGDTRRSRFRCSARPNADAMPAGSSLRHPGPPSSSGTPNAAGPADAGARADAMAGACSDLRYTPVLLPLLRAAERRRDARVFNAPSWPTVVARNAEPSQA